MIPIEYHQNIFERAKRGYSIDFRINKVPNSHLNVYAGRTGRILNIRLKKHKHYQIEWIEIAVDSLGYGKSKLVSFPVEHITLNKPVSKPTYTDYSYERERIVDAFEPEDQDQDQDEDKDNECDDIYDE